MSEDCRHASVWQQEGVRPTLGGRQQAEQIRNKTTMLLGVSLPNKKHLKNVGPIHLASRRTPIQRVSLPVPGAKCYINFSVIIDSSVLFLQPNEVKICYVKLHLITVLLVMASDVR